MINIDAKYKGLITGALMIIICFTFYFFLKIPFNSKEQFLVLPIYILGIVWGLIGFKNTLTEDKTFKNYFQAGFKIFVLVTLLMVIYTIVFYVFNTSVRDKWIAANNIMLLKEGNHMPAEIVENSNQMKKMFLPMMAGISLFKYLLVGALVTAIASFLFSSKGK